MSINGLHTHLQIIVLPVRAGRQGSQDGQRPQDVVELTSDLYCESVYVVMIFYL